MYICYVITIYKFDIFPKISIFKCALCRSTTSCKNILYSGLKKNATKICITAQEKRDYINKIGLLFSGLTKRIWNNKKWLKRNLKEIWDQLSNQVKKKKSCQSRSPAVQTNIFDKVRTISTTIVIPHYSKIIDIINYPNIKNS